MRYALPLLIGLLLTLPLATDAAAQGRGDWWEPVIVGDDDWEDDDWEDDDNRRRRGRDDGWRNRRRRDRDDGWLEDILDDDWEDDDRRWEHRRRHRRKRGRGPAFCRSGAGHPVHGRRWCIEKGWGLGDGRYRDRRWERRRDWGDIIFGRRGRRDRRYDRDPLGVEILEEILGRRGLRRLARFAGSADVLNGRLVVTRRGVRVLQVRAGRRPLAELIDFDRDRRVDVVFLRR